MNETIDKLKRYKLNLIFTNNEGKRWEIETEKTGSAEYIDWLVARLARCADDLGLSVYPQLESISEQDESMTSATLAH